MSAFPTRLSSFFLYFLKPYKLSTVALFLLMSVYALAECFSPYLVKVMIDKLTLDHTLESIDLIKIIGGYLASIFLIDACMRGMELVGAYIMPRIKASIRTAVFEHTWAHSYRFFQDNLAGSLSSRVTNLGRSFEKLFNAIYHGIYQVSLSFIVSACFLWNAHPYFAVILSVWYVAMTIVTTIFSKKTLGYARQHTQAENKLFGHMGDILQNIITVKLFVQPSFENKYLSQYQQEEITQSQRLDWYMTKIELVRGLLSGAMLMAVILLIVYGWKHQWITLGDFAFITSITLSMVKNTRFISSSIMVMYRETGSAQESLQLLNQPFEVADQPNAQALKVDKGEITFDNVTFRYLRNKNVFADQNVTIKPGEKVGLVGFSGSGKTTFVNLILRLFDVTNGRILIDGQDIKSVTQDSLRKAIAVIPQESVLFHRTLRENLQYGDPQASEEAIIEASKKAHCHQFVLQLPDEYESLVGERGVKLSVGQRQRIAIARAILKNAPILILDEATSALDSVTEKLIQQSLDYIMEKRTVLVIAHRLSTLFTMDRILVFKDGRIIEEGTHKELVEKEGHYAMLWQMQVDGFLPEKV